MSCVLYCSAESYARVEDVLYYYIEGQGVSSVMENSRENTMRKLQHAEAAGEHMMAYIHKYAPEYSVLAEKKAEDNLRYILLQLVYYEQDWNKAVENLKLFNSEKYKKLMEYGCQKLIPAKLRRSLGLKITEEDLL